MCISRDVNDVANNDNDNDKDDNDIGKDFPGAGAGRKGCQLFICDKYGWRRKVFCLLIIYRLYYDFRQKVRQVSAATTPLPLPPHTILMGIRVAQWQIINYLRVFTSSLFAVRTFASPVKPRKCFDI